MLLGIGSGDGLVGFVEQVAQRDAALDDTVLERRRDLPGGVPQQVQSVGPEPRNRFPSCYDGS